MSNDKRRRWVGFGVGTALVVGVVVALALRAGSPGDHEVASMPVEPAGPQLQPMVEAPRRTPSDAASWRDAFATRQLVYDAACGDPETPVRCAAELCVALLDSQRDVECL